MSRRLKQAAVVFFIVFAAAQFVRPERANPATGTLHAGASRNAALGPGRRDDLRGSAPGRSEHSRRTEGR